MAASVSECLDEDDVLAFAQGDLDSLRRREVIAHVDGCETCRALAAAVARDTTSDRPPDPPMSDLVDGRYRLEGALGHGATATVFRAKDEKLGIAVALKAVRRTSHDAKGFERELKMGRRITDPNVCRLYDAGTTEDFDFITMELVDGETLAQLLSRDEVPLQRALEILDAIAAGLAAAHEQGVVHRDLKPANVMVEKGSGRVVLMDFGFATHLDANQSRRLVGTPAYWSPEQARGEAATAASDVYSFGVLAYRLLASHDFKLSDPNALDRVPRAYRRPVARCVASSPADRFRNGLDVRRAFDAVTNGGGARSLWPVAALACVAVLGGWFFLRPPAVPEPTIATSTPSATATTSAAAAVSSPAPTLEPAPAPSTSAVASAISSPIVHPPGNATSPRIRPTTAPTASPPPKASEGDLLYVR